MKSIIKETIKYILIFIITVFILTGSLIAVAKIPREAIQDNMLESAEYLASRPSRNFLINSIYAAYTDQLADSILLNITYNFDNQDPLHSIIWAKLSGYDYEYSGQYLFESVRDGVTAEHEYLRYWHGSAVFVRLLHLIFNLHQIYLFHAMFIAALLILLVFILLRSSYIKEAVGVLISMISVSIWTVPFCLEYTWVFLTMLLASIIAVEMVIHGKEQWYGAFFLITGMVTVYLDFLTTETLTLCIPLLLILSIRNRCEKAIRNQWLLTIKASLLWLIGYGGMWAMKWVISSAVLHQDVMQYVTGHISERHGSNPFELSAEFVVQLLHRNVFRLFPFDYGIVGAAIFFVFILMVIVLVYKRKVQLRESINGRMIALYSVIATVPFIRFLVMNNHSYGHSTFTYRALATTVLAICFILGELVEWSRSPGEDVKAEKKDRPEKEDKPEKKTKAVTSNA